MCLLRWTSLVGRATGTLAGSVRKDLHGQQRRRMACRHDSGDGVARPAHGVDPVLGGPTWLEGR